MRAWSINRSGLFNNLMLGESGDFIIFNQKIIKVLMCLF